MLAVIIFYQTVSWAVINTYCCFLPFPEKQLPVLEYLWLLLQDRSTVPVHLLISSISSSRFSTLLHNLAAFAHPTLCLFLPSHSFFKIIIQILYFPLLFINLVYKIPLCTAITRFVYYSISHKLHQSLETAQMLPDFFWCLFKAPLTNEANTTVCCSTSGPWVKPTYW